MSTTTTTRPALDGVPAPRRVDQVDDYHGVAVSDPYRWMEDPADPELGPWIAAEEALTERVLGGSAGRSVFRGRIESILRSAHCGTPIRRGDRWFTSRSDGGEDEGGVWVSDAPEERGRLVLDKATLGTDVLVGDAHGSPDGSLLLWSTTHGGSDWKQWHVTDVASGEVIDDAVGDSKLWASWLPDGTGFLYLGFPAVGEGAHRATGVPELRLHRLRTPQSEDTVVFAQPERPRYFLPRFSDDGRHLVLSFLVSGGGELLAAPVDGTWSFTSVATSPDELMYIGGHGDELIVATTDSAPRGRVVAIDLGDPSRAAWRVVVAESEDVIRPAARVALVGEWVLTIRENIGRTSVWLHRVDGGDAYQVELPGPCDVSIHDISDLAGVTADGRTVYIDVQSPTTPAMLLRHDIGERRTTVVERTEVGADFEVEGELVWCPSADGTRVPMTLVRRVDPPVASDAPVVVEGYGGGGDSMEPYGFMPWKLAWLERGGVVASAHIRGGNELGAEWRAAAERAGKLRAMQDFVACAEALVARGTPPARIALIGRSSGAMLAAAAVISAPTLFGGCVAEVGMFDPLRYHRFGLGSLMISEYGTSENADDFAGMWAYSPLHRIVPGIAYPAFLITSHTDDDRVTPGGQYKFTATLQDAQAGDAPVLLRLQSGAGHNSVAVPAEIAERGDILTFLAMVLGLPAEA